MPMRAQTSTSIRARLPRLRRALRLGNGLPNCADPCAHVVRDRVGRLAHTSVRSARVVPLTMTKFRRVLTDRSPANDALESLEFASLVLAARYAHNRSRWQYGHAVSAAARLRRDAHVRQRRA